METISGAIIIAGQEPGLAPVTVMITITKLELNLKCNIPVLVTCPKAVLNLNSKFTELCEVVSICSILILNSMTNLKSFFHLHEYKYLSTE